jgi:hypothetical protein
MSIIEAAGRQQASTIWEAARLQQATAQAGHHRELADPPTRRRYQHRSDDVWVIDSTPIECAHSRETVRRSDLASWAQYGCCASGVCGCTWQGPTDRFRPGLRQDRRAPDPAGRPRSRPRPGQTLIGDKNYYGRDYQATLSGIGLHMLRPARKDEPKHDDQRFFKPLRQIIESIFDTDKGQLDLERHDGHTPEGVLIRILQRLLALTAAIWHNDKLDLPVLRSLTAYNH